MRKIKKTNDEYAVIASEQRFRHCEGTQCPKQSLQSGIATAAVACCEHSEAGSLAMTCSTFFATILIFSFLWINFALAEVVILKKPLIWKPDKSSDYQLPEASSGAYTSQEFIATAGQIKSITVNWEATGKIDFEVSADNGLHYYAVVNGVPLSKGFISGDRLRWRAQADTDVKLLSVRINYTDTSGVAGDFGEPTLSGFNFRKQLIIDNSAGEELYNYQIKLKIGESAAAKNVDANLSGHSLADFKDIRFSAADAQTPLAYYRESVEGEAGSRIATFWVRVPQIPKAALAIYLYYGNSEASDLSNPNTTFDFYEDFTSKALDKDKWVTYVEQKGSSQLALGGIKLDAAEIVSKSFKFRDGIIEYSCQLESGFENSLNIRSKVEQSYDNPLWSAYSSIYKGAEHCIAANGIVKADDSKSQPTTTGEKYNYRINLHNGKITFERFGTEEKPQASVTYQFEPAPNPGYLSLRSGGDGDGKNIMYFGALRCRKAAEPLPTLGKQGSEESVSLPVFADGYYLSADLAASAEPIRIIIPSWKAEPADKDALKISVSADGGLTYIKECVAGQYYYASKKDFTAGTTLKARVDFTGKRGLSPSLRDSLRSQGTVPFFSELSLDYRPGKINVISPNGKEKWPAGSQQKISWSASDYEATYPLSIAYSTDKGKTYTDIITSKENDGAYLWAVPDNESGRVMVKISDSLAQDIYDTSDAVFSIIAAALGAEGAGQEATAAAALTTQKTLTTQAEQATLAQEAAQKKARAKEKSKKKTPDISGRKLYEILVKSSTGALNPGEERVFDEGDIIMIKPAGFLWGASERQNFTIVQAYLTEAEVEEFMSQQDEGAQKASAGRGKKYKIDLRRDDLLAEEPAQMKGLKLSGHSLVDKTAIISKAR